jgi:hypothetical protein
MSSPFLGLKNKPGPAWCLLRAGFFLGLLSEPQVGGYKFLRNIDWPQTLRYIPEHNQKKFPAPIMLAL